MNKKRETPIIDGLQAEIDSLREAAKLLDALWGANGAYDRTWKIPEDLHTKIQNYFDFDDSE